MTDRERFIALLSSVTLRKAEAVILLEGDGLNRIPFAAKLWNEGYAPLVATFGNDTRREYGSFIELKQALIETGLPEDVIHSEEVAGNTIMEADRAVSFAFEQEFKTLLLVTSPHHQYRAFLTFLQSMKAAGADLDIINAPAPLSWFSENPWGRRIDLLDQEFERIEQYQQKGDVASYALGIEYLERHQDI